MHTAPVRLQPALRLFTGTAGLALALAAAGVGSGARAQDVALAEKESTLRDVTEQLQRQTGYEFHLALNKELEEARHPVSARRASLAATLSELGALFHCDFFSLDASGFYVVATPKPDEVETKAGPYRLRVGPVGSTDQPGVLQLTLQFSGTEDSTEAIAGLDKLQIQDNFGRSLLPVSQTLRTTTGTRVRLNEYWQRIPLFLKDDRAVRLRVVRGNVVLYRKVSPLQLEFPVESGAPPVSRTQSGLEFRVDKVEEQNGRWSLDTRLTWKKEQLVMGQGLSRTPQPYLVDAQGRVYRDVAARLARFRDSNGDPVVEEHLRFGDLGAKPARLVYEVYLKEDPAITVPFRLGPLPLPAAESTGSRAERPFYDGENGGTLLFSVVDRDGKPAEGEVSLGLSLKDEHGWSGIRWLDEVTDADGRVKLEHLRPGTYRVTRVFRLDPALPPVSVGRTPIEIEVQAKAEATLAPLRIPVPAM